MGDGNLLSPHGLKVQRLDLNAEQAMPTEPQCFFTLLRDKERSQRASNIPFLQPGAISLPSSDPGAGMQSWEPN